MKKASVKQVAYVIQVQHREASSNVRPLCRSPPDPGCDYLTPGHFLIGAPLIALPEEHVLSASSCCSRWQHLRQLHQAFWKRWSMEYLKTPQVRSKWTSSSIHLKLGDLVLLSGMSSNPLEWPVGRIVGSFPGSDGITRVVSVQTTRGIFKRPDP